MNKNRIIFMLAVLLLAISFGSGMLTHRSLVKPVQSPPDTVVVYRQVTVEKPVPVAIEPAPPSIPSVSIPTADLQPDPDSSAVQVRPEVKTFADTLDSGLSYKIQVSGVGATLQSFDISWPQRQTVKTVPFRGWSVDLVGRSLLTDFTKEGLNTFLGVELGYTADRFSFSIGPGAMRSRPPGTASHQTSLAVMASVRIRLARLR